MCHSRALEKISSSKYPTSKYPANKRITVLNSTIKITWRKILCSSQDYLVIETILLIHSKELRSTWWTDLHLPNNCKIIHPKQQQERDSLEISLERGVVWKYRRNKRVDIKIKREGKIVSISFLTFYLSILLLIKPDIPWVTEKLLLFSESRVRRQTAVQYCEQELLHQSYFPSRETDS